MDKGLYVAMTGAKHNMRAQAVHANNLANASTSGFFRDFVTSHAMSVQHEHGHESRAHALAANPGTDFSAGVPIQTGNKLDVAVKGNGWLAAQTEDRTEVYVKSAELHIDEAGFLRTKDNLMVLGNGGPIALPPIEAIDIGSDGSISIKGRGESTLSTVDRLRLVEQDDVDLKKRLDGLVVRKDGDPQEASANVGMMSGAIYASNVNPVQTLTEILALSRQYEMQVKMMQNMNETSESASRIMRLS